MLCRGIIVLCAAESQIRSSVANAVYVFFAPSRPPPPPSLYLGGILGTVDNGSAEDASHVGSIGAGNLRSRQAPRVGDGRGQDHIPRPGDLQEVRRDSFHASHRGVSVVRDGARADSLRRFFTGGGILSCLAQRCDRDKVLQGVLVCQDHTHSGDCVDAGAEVPIIFPSVSWRLDYDSGHGGSARGEGRGVWEVIAFRVSYKHVIWLLSTRA